MFRCNRFDPGADRFAAHVDAPYADPACHHVSKHTLLLYLTGGRGAGALRFGDRLVVDEIEAMTAYLFDQDLAHEGGPYEEGPKRFLRTELVFEDREVVQVPGIAAAFAKACYLSQESVFAPELARFAHAAHDRAAAAHWRGIVEEHEAEPFVHRRFRSAHFLTNGHDYWFAEGALSIAECAGICLLDALGVQIGGVPFRDLCSAEIWIRDSDDRGWIGDRLRAIEADQEPVFSRLNADALFPAPEAPDARMGFPDSPDFSAEPFPDGWDATRHPRVIGALEDAQAYAKAQLFAAPITLCGQEVCLDPDRFVVTSDRICVLSSEALAPLHFAGAVFYSPEDFVEVDVSIDALRLVVPPIPYRSEAGILHLTFDLFRNGFMVRQQRETIPVPRVDPSLDAPPDVRPWRTAAIAGSRLDAEQFAAAYDDGRGR